jgi:nicotinamidase-related amidase
MNFTIKPRHEQNEIIISKHTASIFIDTGFERMLKNAGISTVVFTGIATEFGIESSARDIQQRIYPVVISDCTSSPNEDGHNRSIENMRNTLITVINSKEIGNIWSSDTTSDIYDLGNGIHREQIGDASKSNVSPNTPPADEADI